MLSVYQDDEIDLCTDELAEIPADFMSKETKKVAVAKDKGNCWNTQVNNVVISTSLFNE